MLAFIQNDQRYFEQIKPHVIESHTIMYQLFACKDTDNNVIYPSLAVFCEHILPMLVINGYIVPKEDARVLYEKILNACKNYFESNPDKDVFCVPNTYSMSYSFKAPKMMKQSLMIINVYKNFCKSELKLMRSNEELLDYLTFRYATYPKELIKLGGKESITNLLMGRKLLYKKPNMVTRNFFILYLNQQFVTFELSGISKPSVRSVQPADAYVKVLKNYSFLYI